MATCNYNDIYHAKLCSSRALVHWLTSLTLLSPRRATVSQMCRLNAHRASTETWLSRPPAANAAVTMARPASPGQHPSLWRRMRSLLWERSSAAWSAKVGPAALRLGGSQECEIRGTLLLWAFRISHIQSLAAFLIHPSSTLHNERTVSVVQPFVFF